MKANAPSFNLRQVFVWSFLLNFAPVVMLAMGLGVWTIELIMEMKLEQTSVEQEAVLKIQTSIITEEIDDSLEKLHGIAIDPELAAMIAADNRATRKVIEKLFVALLLRNRQFAQILYTDESGREKVRVERRGEQIVPVAEDSLQDKSQRDDFHEIMRLPPGKIYVSPLDLDAEHDRSDAPLKPVLRVATPVQDSRANPRGIVIIKVNAASLLDKLPRQHFTRSQLMWLDEAGYWLRSFDPHDEWGLQQGSVDTFASRHPDVWGAMAQTNQGHFSNALGFWSWDALCPQSADFGSTVAKSPCWRLVSLFPASVIKMQHGEIMKKVAPLVLVSLVVFAALIAMQIRLREKNTALDKERLSSLLLIKKITNLLPGVVYQFKLTPDGRFCFPYASEALRNIYRVSPEEVKEDASKIFAVIHPEDLANVKASIQKSAETLTSWNEDYRVCFGDGTVRWLHGSSMPEKQAEGSVLWYGYSHDITDGKAQQTSLESLVERLRATINIALDCIIIMDRDGRIIKFNPAAEHCFGYRRQDVIGRVLSEIIVPEKYRQAHTQGLKHYLETGEGPVLRKRIEIEAMRKDGSEFPVEMAIDVARSANEEFFVAYLRDITERKQAEVELRRSQEELSKLALLAARTDNAVVFTDAEGRIEWVNDGFTRITGWRLDEVIGRKPGEFLQGPETDPAAVRYMGECVRAGRAFSSEVINYHRDGGKYWTAIEVQPILNEAGEVMNFMAIESDITERKRTQVTLEEYSQHLEQLVKARTDELLRNQSFLEAIIKTTPNGVLLIDHEGKICMTNTALERMFGYAAAELLGHPLENLVPATKREMHKDLRQHFMQQPRTRTMGVGLDLFGQRKDGSCFPVDVSLAAFSVNEEQYIQATVADISARKLAEESLRDMNANLEHKVELRTAELAAASAAKSEFLANMSHEIRTPMNGIMGLAQLLEREPLTADQHDMVEQIRHAGHSLLVILNDILDLSKIEAGQLRIDPRPFALAPMLAQLNSLMGPSAHAKGLDLLIEVTTGSEVDLIGDGLRLEQILINLIGNAIKFTEQGEIKVSVQTRVLTETSVRLRFEVGDTGIAIAPDQLAVLFKPFTQADGTITRRFGGTGLGLSICKRLVELMGGEIGVESTVGVGSTFWFELPFERTFEAQNLRPAPSPRSVVQEPRLSGLHCLVVDDSRMNREVVERTLIREGAHATLAVDGQQALQYLQAQGDLFDVVLMDVQMPVLDGLAATRAIRDELGLKDLPVIAFTAGVMPEQREQARAAGCNDFVAKPVDLEELVAVLLRWTSLAAPSIPVSVQELPKGFPDIPGLDIEKARALLGDDPDLFLELLKSFAAEFSAAAEESREDLAKGDRESAARRLHTLRGAAGYLGAADLVRAAQVLENAIKDQASDLEPLLNAFDQKLATLLKASTPWRI